MSTSTPLPVLLPTMLIHPLCDPNKVENLNPMEIARGRLSPSTTRNALAAHNDIPYNILKAMCSALANTINACQLQYDAHTHVLMEWALAAEGKIKEYKEKNKQPPEGFKAAKGNASCDAIHIPVGNGVYRPAWWVKQVSDGKVAAYFYGQNFDEQPYICDITHPLRL